MKFEKAALGAAALRPAERALAAIAATRAILPDPALVLREE